MATKITDLLKEATKGILQDESLQLIESAFNEELDNRAKLQVESALVKQDAEYTEKLEKLVEAIDNDHVKKLQRIVEAQDLNNVAKLKTVVDKYNKILKEDARQFKESLSTQISDYLELYLDEVIPQKTIEEACANKRAYMVLKNLRQTLAVDSALMSESIKDAVIDGKTKLNEAATQLDALKAEVKVLKENLAKTQADLILEQKTAGLSTKKKEYAKRVLNGKSPKFIMENIDYTISLYDKKENEHVDILKEDALKECQTLDDRSVAEPQTTSEVIEEQTTDQVDPMINTYLSSLQHY